MPGWTHLRLDGSGTTARQLAGAVAVDLRLPPSALASLREAVLSDGAPRPASLQVEAEEGGEPAIRWLQGAFVAAEIDGGPVGELDFMGVDVTAVRAAMLTARREVRRSRTEAAWFQGLVDHASDVITAVTPESVVTYANPAIRRELGYAPGDLVGDHMLDRVHPDDHDAVQRTMEEVLRHPDETRRVEVRLRHADGRWLWFECRGVYGGGVGSAAGEEVSAAARTGEVTSPGVVVLSRNVTERRRAERQLELSLEKYDTFFELIPVGVVLSDPESGAMYEVNRRFREIFGYDDEEILDRTSLELGMWEDPERRAELVERARTRGGLRGEEAWFRTAGGERRRLRLSCRRLRLVGEDRLLWAVDDVTEVRRRDEVLHLQRDALETTDHAIVITDREGSIEWVNPAFTEMTGYSREEAVGETPALLGSGEQDEAFYEEFWETILAGETWRGEIVNRRRNGELYTEWMSVVPVRHGSDEITHFIALKRDVTERKARERALVRSEQRYRSLFEDSVDPVVLTTAEGKILDANPAFTEQFGYERTELERLTVDELWAEPGDREAFLGRLGERGLVRDLEVRFETRDGEVRTCRISAREHRDQEGRVDYVQGVLHDVTELKRMEERLRHRALHDPLTDAANRDLLRERIQGAMARSDRSGEPLAVAVVDLNRFKRINDSLGHAVGDRVLAEVVARLRQELREQDTVARIGGDEFALLLEGVEGELAVRSVLERVRGALERPYEVAGESFDLDQAVGVVLYRSDGQLEVEAPEDLVRYADLAMYRVKEEENGSISFFRPEKGHERMSVMRREQELRRAIEDGELVAYFQPVLELASGRVLGFEALARWEHPERGTIAPDGFLPLAEESGLVVPLGRSVIEQACDAVAGWNRNRPPGGEPLSLFVNVSVRQLAEEGMAAGLHAMVQERGLEPGLVTVEVTETALMRGGEEADRLVGRGFRLAIDDFGTGYASLAYLKLMEVDVLKIDRSFVSGLGEDPADSAIVETVVTLGGSLGIDVLAEGIETDDQLGRLRELGCRFGQGYHLGRPVPADDVPDVLAGSGRGKSSA